ncbi:hypothetical protein [Corynebacterium crudilactis]|uniref:Hsp70 family protein n=1 Tax=Corynebacterium crudilactis TaxID=1652495 RepID=A0A172QXT1_9CORY|nr:hypothetical protein [Corynebacterium crudilactis]ANE05451.1 hypothetical protein ccrud_14010 [Corynebacterium crudilactis]
MAHNLVLGIDLGTATIATALAETGEQPTPLPIINNQPHYPATLLVDTNGEIKRPDYTGDTTQHVTNLTTHLGQPPQIIANTPWGANALIEMAIRPAIDAATDEAGQRPTHIAAVVPTHWPDYITTAYTKALETTGLPVTTIGADEATAHAATLNSTTTGAVTCIDFGENKATLTMALPKENTHIPDIHRADPNGGRRHLDTELTTRIATHLDPTFTPTPQWETQAHTVGQQLRTKAHATTHPEDLIEITLPAPFSTINISAGQVSDLVEDLAALTLKRLTANPDITHIWNVDEDDNTPRSLLITGGFSTDKAVGTAIRTTIGAWRAHPNPQAIIATAAADLVESTLNA